MNPYSNCKLGVSGAGRADRQHLAPADQPYYHDGLNVPANRSRTPEGSRHLSPDAH